MTMFAAWHPRKKFGPVEDISLRKTLRAAEEDARVCNFVDGKMGWRAVAVDLTVESSHGSEPYSPCLAEMFE